MLRTNLEKLFEIQVINAVLCTPTSSVGFSGAMLHFIFQSATLALLKKLICRKLAGI